MRYSILVVFASLLALGACRKAERPKQQAASVAAPATVEIDIAQPHLRFTYLDTKGRFKMAQRAKEVPEKARGAVMVVDLSKRAGMGAKVPVLDLRDGKLTGRLQARSLDRAAFDRLARRLLKRNRPPVVMYATSWCGVCAKARSFLRSEGVEWKEHDIEKDANAAKELREKAARAGVQARGVPVFDIAGTLVPGFDEGRLRTLLKL